MLKPNTPIPTTNHTSIVWKIHNEFNTVIIDDSLQFYFLSWQYFAESEALTFNYKKVKLDVHLSCGGQKSAIFDHWRHLKWWNRLS